MLNSRSETLPLTDPDTGAIVGREFAAGGALVSPTHAVGYPKFEREYHGARGVLCDWNGAEIGHCRIVATWRTPRSWVSSTMHQIEATIDGRRYTGRGAGSGMIWKGRAKRA